MQTEDLKTNFGEESPSKTTIPSEWNDWKWQIRNRIRTVEGLASEFDEVINEEVFEAAVKFPMAITPYYASLIRNFDESDPVYRMAVPSKGELVDPPFLSDDPLHEEEGSPVEGLVHRYKDRALVISTSICSMYCRFCTRKRVTGQQEHCSGSRQLEGWVSYLKAHPEVKDVIVSGGDPFTLETDKLDEILTAIRSVSSVEVIRVGTRTPVVMPMRITPGLVSMLRKHHPLWVNTHFNHPNEVTKEAMTACSMLADAGIPLGNQSVLLKGVNDDPLVMEDLCRKLVRMRVRPSYVFSPDKVRGTAHFQTTVETGLKVMEHLQVSVGSIATPLFVVDLEDGGGKIPILPNRVMSMDGNTVTLRNKKGTLSIHSNC